MSIKCLFLLLTAFLLLNTTRTANAQEAIFAIPNGVLGHTYKQDVPEVLRTQYRREMVSQKGLIEWSAIRPLPPGIELDANGILFGAPQVARTYTIRVLAIDTAQRDVRPTSLSLSFTVLKKNETLAKSGPPTLRQTAEPPQENRKSTEEPDVQIEIGDFPLGEEIDLPLKVISSLGVALQAIVFPNEGKPQSVFTDALPIGEVRTSIKLELQPGRNTVSIRDVGSARIYKTVTIDVPKQKETVARQAPNENRPTKKAEVENTDEKQEGAKEKDPKLKDSDKQKGFEIKYSRLIDKSALTTPITVTVVNADIGKLKVMVTETDKTDVLHKYLLSCAKANKECPLEISLPDAKKATAHFVDVTGVEDPDTVGLPDKKSGKGFAIDFVREGNAAVSTIPFSSINTRAIVGFEQAGASASPSSSKPLLDFFFTAPLWFKPENDGLSRLSLWGNIRLAAIPSQVSTLGVLPTNFVNQVGEGKLSELVQGFDFLAGPEFRLHTSKRFASLIPGIKQQTDVYLAGGFGAISPLDPKERENVQIFTVPATTSSQYEEFKIRFPEAAASGRPYIALTYPERDRFLRQYYAGFRFKTHFSKDGEILNRFPAILDLMLGRNEAVTGGRLKHAVLRIEGFYPLPIKEADFLYIYGTSMMTFGGGGVKINKPLFLDTPGSTVGLSDPNLFIVPNRQNNSDYYRIGVGVDLMKLFNRKPKG